MATTADLQSEYPVSDVQQAEHVTQEHLDVLIVGAGISGIGGAVHLQERCPNASFALLEGRPALGGTWDLFRYPGVRSDSDMHTLGYRFKPWKHEKSIADGAVILDYLNEVVSENDLARHIRFSHKVSKAQWSSTEAQWTVTAERTDTTSGAVQTTTLTCGFLFMCSGYYSYREGYTPAFSGRDDFQGTIIHPQNWPEDIDYNGQRIVVIGSGATAMTLVPALAETAAHVTMVQRSPTYVVARPARDAIANRIRKFLPDRLAYAVIRRKNIFNQGLVYRKTRTEPDKVRKLLLAGVREGLGPDYDVDRHFSPSYNPWDQRLCLIRDGDLFKTIRSGKVSIVTEQIETFTEKGLRLSSGLELEADLIVTATGLNLVTLGEMEFEVDGQLVDFSRTWTYRGLAYSGIPNLVSTFGYVNASWTLKADLTSEYVCRLLNHMAAVKATRCTPNLRLEDAEMPERQWIEDFPAGYMQRSMHLLPRQGDREPWLNPQDYRRDVKMIRRGAIDDGVMSFDAPNLRTKSTK
ncbi:MAG: NAD(P)/FAD-dependent oxidoreductase [Acidimicrobiales bacterium]|nr:NAD(P)/FAD-dependent oxidoreductase [Acidimicrobiales bacterium]